MHGAGHGCPFCIPLLWFIQNDSKQGIPLKSKSDYFHLADEAGVPLAPIIKLGFRHLPCLSTQIAHYLFLFKKDTFKS
jgi:hypothetical protein